VPGPRSYELKDRGRQVERTRERVIRAAREALLSRSWEDVSLATIAADADVTTQTVINHFQSKKGLLMAVVAALGAEVDRLRGSTEPGDVTAAVSSLMRQYEVLGIANVTYVHQADRDAEIAGHVEQARRAHRAWLEDVFADSLAGAANQQHTIAALYAATDVGTWKLLRKDLRLSQTETAAVLDTLIRGVLERG
jgi:AcrR family transcriptional regulator